MATGFLRHVLLMLAAAALVAPCHGLSWPLCDEGGQVWVTEKPRTEPTFPGANLWFFCSGGLNFLGTSIDPCIKNGTVCVPEVYDAICQAIGLDMAWDEAMGGEPATITNATKQEAVRSLTGEYCLRAGVYSKTVPDNLASLPGEPCQKVDSITCIRNRETIITALQDANLTGFERVPPAAEPVLQPETTVARAEQAATATAGGTAGRKLLRL